MPVMVPDLEVIIGNPPWSCSKHRGRWFVVLLLLTDELAAMGCEGCE